MPRFDTGLLHRGETLISGESSPHFCFTGERGGGISHINEEITRLFFEINGFLVRTNLPFPVGKGSPDSDIDLAVQNTQPSNPARREFILDSNGLKGLKRAIVEVKGYHTERFTRSVMDDDMFRFATSRATEVARRFFNGKPFERIFVVSRLPVKNHTRKASLDFMRFHGVNHVLEFETILQCLVAWVRPEPDYDSEFLQAIRLLKNYEYLPDRERLQESPDSR